MFVFGQHLTAIKFDANFNGNVYVCKKEITGDFNQEGYICSKTLEKSNFDCGQVLAQQYITHINISVV